MRGKNRRQEQESSVLKMARGNNGEKNERLGNQALVYKMSIAAPFDNKTYFCLYTRIPELPIWFFSTKTQQ